MTKMELNVVNGISWVIVGDLVVSSWTVHERIWRKTTEILYSPAIFLLDNIINRVLIRMYVNFAVKSNPLYVYQRNTALVAVNNCSSTGNRNKPIYIRVRVNLKRAFRKTGSSWMH